MSTKVNNSIELFSLFSGERKTQFIVLSMVFLFISTVLQYFFSTPIDTFLGTISLGGLGVFLWIFVFLVILFMFMLNHIQQDYNDLVEVTRNFNRQRGPTTADWDLFLKVYGKEQKYHPFVFAGYGTVEALMMAVENDTAIVNRVVRYGQDRIQQLLDILDNYAPTVCFQFGLAGTMVSLGYMLKLLAAGAKNLGNASGGGGKILTILSESHLDTAFSTTLAAALISIMFYLMSGSTKQNIQALKRQLPDLKRKERQREDSHE
ncbi:MAG TPA: hypothetical protein P5077_02175 [bacterium]|nr:hypothetical protein [bacterium]